MEQIVNLHIEKLPEGLFLATSDEIPGLVAQGRTVSRRQQITFTSSMLLRSIGAWMTKRGLPESSNCFAA